MTTTQPLSALTMLLSRHTRRRAFIFALAGAAAWPLATRAQQAGRLPIIGFLGSSTTKSQAAWVAAFVERLRELGWVDGHTVVITYRWAEGRSARFAEIAAEFVRLNVDVIFANIPIVFPVGGDPVGTGLVAS